MESNVCYMIGYDEYHDPVFDGRLISKSYHYQGGYDKKALIFTAFVYPVNFCHGDRLGVLFYDDLRQQIDQYHEHDYGKRIN